MTIIDKNNAFVIVNEYPKGYVVWAIGREHFKHECYVPLARLQEDGLHVDRASLKAIKVKDEPTALRILREAVLRGVGKRKFERMV